MGNRQPLFLAMAIVLSGLSSESWGLGGLTEQCEISNFTFQANESFGPGWYGEVGQPFWYPASGTGTGKCSDDFGNSWRPVTFQFDESIPTTIVNLVAGTRYVFHGHLQIWESSPFAHYSYGATIVASDVPGEYKHEIALYQDGANLGGEVCYADPTGCVAYSLAGSVVGLAWFANQFVGTGLPSHRGDLFILSRNGATFTYTGHLSLTPAGLPLVIADSPAAEFIPDELEEVAYSEDVPEDVVEWLEGLPDYALADLPELSDFIITSNYTIIYRFINALGQYQTNSAPGLLGVPALISIPNRNNNNVPEQVTVLVTPGDDGSTLSLTIQRDATTLPGGCKELPADIRISADVPKDLSNPLGPSVHVELGYQSLQLDQTYLGSAPQKFSISAGNLHPSNGVSIEATESCGVKRKLNLVGQYRDLSEGTDIALLGVMPQLVQKISLTETADSSRKSIAYDATDFVQTLSLSGTRNSNTFRFSIDNLPHSVVLCSAQGNGCTVAWRAGNGAEGSAQFLARTSDGAYRTVIINVTDTDLEVHENGTVTSRQTKVENLNLSYLSFDRKLKSSFSDLWRTGGGRWPKYLYIHSASRAFRGRIRTSKSNGKSFELNIPNNTYANNRELRINKKHWYSGPKLKKSGFIVCGPGLEFKVDDLPGILGYPLVVKLCTL